MNSTRSISTNSDHYAIVHSRPGSRYSPGQKNGHRGPPSNLGSHYSGKMWSVHTELWSGTVNLHKQLDTLNYSRFLILNYTNLHQSFHKDVWNEK